MATAPSQPITRRLHIGGLTPAIKPDDLVERFSRYGTVESMESVGEDGLGRPRTFAFLTIKTTQQNLTKCLNTMQGSMWRGAKLKIGEAKMKWDRRLEIERNPSKAPPLNEKQLHKLDLKKRKAKKMALAKCSGTELADMRPVGAGVLGKRKHWKLTDEGALLRPIFTRPTHPLPPTISPSTGIAGSTTTSANPVPLSKRHRPSTKRGRPMLLRRAKRVYLDPSKWDAHHMGEEDFMSFDEGDELRDGSWEWIEHENTDTAETEGRWEYKQGEKVKFVEEVKNKRRRVEDVLNAMPMRERMFVDEVVIRAKAMSNKEREEEMASSDTDDDEDLWGGLPALEEGVEAEDDPLFPIRKKHVQSTKKAPPPAPKEHQLEPEEDSVSTISDDTDDLFANVPVMDLPGSPLFRSQSASVPSSPSIEASGAPSSFASDSASHDGDRLSDFEVEGPIPPPPGEAGFAQFVANERRKGLEVLKAFGMSAE